MTLSLQDSRMFKVYFAVRQLLTLQSTLKFSADQALACRGVWVNMWFCGGKFRCLRVRVTQVSRRSGEGGPAPGWGLQLRSCVPATCRPWTGKRTISFSLLHPRQTCWKCHGWEWALPASTHWRKKSGKSHCHICRFREAQWDTSNALSGTHLENTHPTGRLAEGGHLPSYSDGGRMERDRMPFAIVQT